VALAALLALAACGRSAPAPTARPGACGARVLVIPDEAPEGAAPVAVALEAAGLSVTTSLATSVAYAGLPSPADGRFAAIVLLSGAGARPVPRDLPTEGQRAIADFASSGGGLVLSEWAAFHVAAEPPRWQLLAPLVLLDRRTSTHGRQTWSVAPAFASHPIWAGLPASFTFDSTSNVGFVRPGSGAASVATSPDAGDVVALRDGPGGRVAHLAHAGNQLEEGWQNVNVQALLVNAALWAARCR
jgi:hypothetical protein